MDKKFLRYRARTGSSYNSFIPLLEFCSTYGSCECLECMIQDNGMLAIRFLCNCVIFIVCLRQERRMTRTCVRWEYLWAFSYSVTFLIVVSIWQIVAPNRDSLSWIVHTKYCLIYFVDASVQWYGGAYSWRLRCTWLLCTINKFEYVSALWARRLEKRTESRLDGQREFRISFCS